MEPSRFVELYDSCWFEMEIFKKKPSLSKSPNSQANPGGRNQDTSSKPEISRVPTLILRSMSHEFCPKSSFNHPVFSVSPDSVLVTPKLQTILSGKEISTEEENSIPKPTQRVHVEESPRPKRKPGRRRGKRTSSKSLSELEFEELKGFMDLGFVFSEEDKDSSLVSIIPGLQRLGKKDHDQKEEEEEEEKERLKEESSSSSSISRPYLSEAWEVLDKRRRENALMNWGIPSMANEIDIKDHLRWWAHTVASTVR